MSEYITQSQITTDIPAPVLNDALDDDGDGTADAGLLDSIIQNASGLVDGYLAGRYAVPFAGQPPATVVAATRAFTLYTIWTRRPSVGDPPKTVVADYMHWKTILTEIGNRERNLDVNVREVHRPGAVDKERTSWNAQST